MFSLAKRHSRRRHSRRVSRKRHGPITSLVRKIMKSPKRRMSRRRRSRKAKLYF